MAESLMSGRKHIRFAVQLPVSFSGDRFSGEGTILNVSAEGCAITSETVAGTGVYLQLAMRLWERDEPIQIDLAAVRWVSAARFGVEFIKIGPGERKRLKTFVKALELTA